MSTVSAQNQKYVVSDPSGATKLNKKGETVPVKINTRTFTIRCIEDGTILGFPSERCRYLANCIINSNLGG